MSFCGDVKAEASRIIPSSRCCLLAEIEGIICSAGVISGNYVRVTTSSPHAARAMYRIARQVFENVSPLQTRKNRLTGETVWVLNTPLPPSGSIAKLCCVKSFLRGAFLAGGYVSPLEKDYHAEFLCRNPKCAPKLKQALMRVGIRAGELSRSGRKVIYTKDADHIAKLLNLVGAHTALMELENRRALKELTNQVNRVVNMDTANAEKTVSAAEKQIEDIKLIDELLGLHKLSLGLQSVAKLRLAHPEASLAELASLACPPLTKSAVNHRLRKLRALAQGLKNHYAQGTRRQEQ
ncbi:MAG TPA: DNA-binding protein WhiA [Firmicutes bacterium]|nr:DNA-binding protein WhiA [Bacillota bacterium]